MRYPVVQVMCVFGRLLANRMSHRLCYITGCNFCRLCLDSFFGLFFVGMLVSHPFCVCVCALSRQTKKKKRVFDIKFV